MWRPCLSTATPRATVCCPEANPSIDKGAPAISWKVKEIHEVKPKAKHGKSSKVEDIMLQKQLN